MSGRRALLLVNAKARQGSTEFPRSLELLRARGLTLIDVPTDHPEEIPKLIARESSRADLVILGGGDGTMNLSVEAVLKSGLPLGILPLGTANDLARTLGIPATLDEACGVIAEGRTQQIDLGRVNGKHFFNVASLGMSVEIARCLTGDVKRRWGVMSYCVTALERYRATRPFTAFIEADGRTLRERSIQLSVGNGRFYGGGMSVSEDAAIDDGMLDLYTLAPSSLLRLVTLLPAFRAGRHRELKEVATIRAAHIQVRTSRPMPINTDGELTAETPAQFDVVPRVLTVFAPNGRDASDLKESQDAAA